MEIISKDGYKILIEDFENHVLYDGSQIAAHYVAENYQVIGNSILIFRGGMRLSSKEMLDMQDVIREGHLADILISSEDCIHFIIEEFDYQPPNIEIEYYRLRLLTQLIIEKLVAKGCIIERRGTDIYIKKRKLNVGIAAVGLSSSKIHFGLNISAKGVPEHVKAIGLLEIGLKEKDLYNWCLQTAEQYIEEVLKVKNDITKTKLL